MLAYFINGNDVRVIQARGSFSFQPKSLKVHSSSRRVRPDNLYRDSAVETFLSCAINYSLTSASDFLQQFVIAKDLRRLRIKRHFASVPGSDIAMRRLVHTAGVIDLSYSFFEHSKT